jgi:hypothetical protein
MLDKTSNRSFLFIKYPASLRLKQWHYDSPQLVGLRQSFASMIGKIRSSLDIIRDYSAVASSKA